MQDFLKTYQNDPRVLLWDLYNEPMSHGLGAESLPLVQAVFEWAWEVAPSQPLTVGAYGPGELEAVALKLSDIVTFHQYPAPDTNRFKETGRPVICTEWVGLNQARGRSLHRAPEPMKEFAHMARVVVECLTNDWTYFWLDPAGEDQ